MSEIDNIKELIESSWENIADLSPENKDVIDAVNTTILKLDSGELRIAEKKDNNEWQVNQWLKKAVLISFRINENSILNLLDKQDDQVYLIKGHINRIENSINIKFYNN